MVPTCGSPVIARLVLKVEISVEASLIPWPLAVIGDIQGFGSDSDQPDAAGGFAGWIQPVIATHSLNLSAGVWKPSVLRGLSFNCLGIELSCSCE